MPMCLACNRPFRDGQALRQHLASSGDNHPTCIPCNKRFISEIAKAEHTGKKHPPIYPCNQCQRDFKAQFALEDHYRGSAAHPNCVKCGKGFINLEERDKHHDKEHPKISCVACAGMLVYEDALADHYRKSPRHSVCLICGAGFKDSSELNHHKSDPNAHPECKLCQRIFKDDEEYHAHVEGRGHIDIAAAQASQANAPVDVDSAQVVRDEEGADKAAATVSVAPPRIPSRGPRLAVHAGVSSTDSSVPKLGAVFGRTRLDDPILRARWAAIPNVVSSKSLAEARVALPPALSSGWRGSRGFFGIKN